MPPPNIFFTSDSHFDHANILKYCNRPFSTVEEMNRILIWNWNGVVGERDIVYHLGDFHLGQRSRIEEIVGALRGKIILILGNHDRSATAMREAGFAEVHESLRLDLYGTKLFLKHEPAPLEAYRRGANIHLCGHVHTAWKRQGSTINVGVDQWAFRPVTLRELLVDGQR